MMPEQNQKIIPVDLLVDTVWEKCRDVVVVLVPNFIPFAFKMTILYGSIDNPELMN